MTGFPDPIHLGQSQRLMPAGIQAERNKGKERADQQQPAPERTLQHFQSVLTSSSSFPQMANELRPTLAQTAPQSVKQLRSLVAAHPRATEQLQRNGWHQTKREHSMTQPGPDGGISMEEYRAKVVDGVIKVCLDTMKAMGYDPPGKHTATGTPGWDSDIDTVYLAPSGMPEEMQTTEKLLFDLVFQSVFNELPGFLFDTESYLNHTSAAFNTAEEIATPEGKQEFVRAELNSVLYQQLQQSGGVGSPEWEGWKESVFGSDPPLIADPATRAAMAEAIHDVETLATEVERGVEDRAMLEHDPDLTQEDLQEMDTEERQERLGSIVTDNPDALRQAKMSYKAGGLLELSRSMDRCRSRITELRATLDAAVQNGTSAHTDPALRDLHQANISKIRADLDIQQVKLATMGSLRTTFFDEGYNTQGAFKRVCFNVRGQMYQRKVEDHQKDLVRRHRSFGTESPLSPHHHTFGFQLESAQKQKSTPVENLFSALENRAMYQGHYHHKAEGGNIAKQQSAVIATSKYSERTTSAMLDLLDQLADENPNLKEQPRYFHLRSRVQGMHDAVSKQEQVKRQKVLNVAQARAELEQALVSPKLPLEESKRRLDIIRETLEVFSAISDDPSTLPQDKYLVLFSRLVGAGLIQDEGLSEPDGLPESREHLEVNHIIQACCGLPISDYPGVRTVLNRAAGSNLLALQELRTSESIEEFNQKFSKMTDEVMALALSEAVIPNPAGASSERLSMNAQWQLANQRGAGRE